MRNNRNGWLHDEISGWVSPEGEEMAGLLESRWLDFDDKDKNGTEWLNEKGERINLRKGGNIDIIDVLKDNYYTLLPEYYLRPYEAEYITIDELDKKISSIMMSLKKVFK